MIPMTLAEAATAIGTTCDPRYSYARIIRVVTDSQEVQPGDLFFAIRGDRLDGHVFIPEAAAKGAAACVCDREWFQGVGQVIHLPSPSRIVKAGQRPALPISCLVADDTVSALGRLAAYYRRSVMHPATVVIAVTGTNGKTTVKSMIDRVLRPSLTGRAAPKSFNNQIGVPLTLLSAEREDRYLIVEIGTNAPGEVATLARMASPSAAVITSIGEAHLEGLGCIDGVAAEKASLLHHVRPCGLVVVNIDQPKINKYLRDRPRCTPTYVGGAESHRPPRLFTVGTDPNAKLRVTIVHSDIRGTTFELDGPHSADRVSVSMPGMHHATNAAAAFAVARWFGIATEEIVDRLQSFTPPTGRGRLLDIGDVLLVDDSYNANPTSMAAAVETLCRSSFGRRVFVMGDMLELGEASASFHRRVVRAVLTAGIEVLVAVGAATTQAVRSSKGAPCLQTRGRQFREDRISSPTTEVVGHPTHVILCEDAVAASDALMTLLEPGDVVWVKGSRAMGLDRVILRLRARLGPKSEPRASNRVLARPRSAQAIRLRRSGSKLG